MNNRERIIATVLGTPADRVPYFSCLGPWGETIDRWKAEGMTGTWDEGLDFDAGFQILPVNLGYCPGWEPETIEVRERTVIVRDAMGILQEQRKGGSTIPHYIDYPVKDRETWEAVQWRLNPSDPKRFPDNWADVCKKFNNGDAVNQLGSYPWGLFGTARDMMGLEPLLVSFYTQPELVHDIMDKLTTMWLSIYEKVVQDVRVDCIHIWEDMSGKDGSLISPAMIREFMIPNYKRIATFAKKHDIPILSVDTDGDCTELIPVFMEADVNLMFPFEVLAGCDVVAYREQYPTLAIMGGIDKVEISKGKEAIDAELERVSSMWGKQYLPSLDHCIHPQISLEDWRYYCKRLKEMCGK